MKTKSNHFSADLPAKVAIWAGVVGIVLVSNMGLNAYAADVVPDMSPDVRPVGTDLNLFRADPSYDSSIYNSDDQIKIYGGKRGMDEPRPLLELGRPIYQEGPFKPGINIVGTKNLLYPGLSIYGDLRTAVAFNDAGAAENGLIATRLNVDVDLKLTATERIHAQLRPLDQGGTFSKFEFFGDDRQQGDIRLDLNLESLFFEGDAGAIAAGFTDTYNGLDLPFSVGLMPLLYQNGIWMDDAITGGAFALSAMSNKTLDISNMDFSFFAGFDKVSTPAIVDDQNALADHSVHVFGVATFIEANNGYWEAGIGRIDGQDGFNELSYTSATLAFTKRYGGIVSNSLRAIYTFDQDRDNNAQQTADGWMLLAENSLITSLPSTFVPYANFWVGFDRPQPLADATGLLKNTGITFETNGLTGLPKLDDTGHDTFGGAIGVEYLFNLDQQVVAEISSVQIMGDANNVGRAAVDDQYGFGLRYQLPISPSWIFRADAMYGIRTSDDDVAGVSAELRVKF